LQTVVAIAAEKYDAAYWQLNGVLEWGVKRVSSREGKQF